MFWLSLHCRGNSDRDSGVQESGTPHTLCLAKSEVKLSEDGNFQGKLCYEQGFEPCVICCLCNVESLTRASKDNYTIIL